MIDRPRRFVLFMVALACATSLLLKGRAVSPKGDVAAFLPGWREQPGAVTIRIRGNVIRPGIYQVAKAKKCETVTNMTVSSFWHNFQIEGIVLENVYSGDIVTLSRDDRKHIEKSKETMAVIEKILLGIPLDPNRMSISDWEKLPGIGPVMADRIVGDRQKYGEFSSVSDLKRVSGIGDVRLRQMERYFKHDLTH